MRRVALLFAVVIAACDARRAIAPRDAGEAGVAPIASAVMDLTPLAPPDPTLALDVAARSAAARALFGAAVALRVEGDIFVLVGADGGLSFDANVALAHDALAVLRDGRLAVWPDRAVTVWIFASPARYEAFLTKRVPNASWHTPFGLYHAATREIFVNAAGGVGTLTHELLHPLLQADFPHAPTWLVEGLASLYERPDLSVPGEIHGKPNFRRDDLLAALGRPLRAGPPRLDALFAMSNEAFRAPKALEALHYAMAREALRWLDAGGNLWPFYRAWRDGVLDDPTGEKAFTTVVGKTPAEANAAWVDWVEGKREAP